MKKLFTLPINLNSISILNLIRFGLLMTLILPFIWLTACEDQSKLKPETKDSTQTDPCKKNHTGDHCFKNSLKDQITVQLYDGQNIHGSITVQPGKIGWFYELSTGKHEYSVFLPSRQGEIWVIECNKDTTEID